MYPGSERCENRRGDVNDMLLMCDIAYLYGEKNTFQNLKKWKLIL